MKTNDIGKYILVSLSKDQELILRDNNTIIAFQGDEFFERKDYLSISLYNAVYLISILEESIEIVNIFKQDKNYERIKVCQPKDEIILNGKPFIIKYECNENHLEELLYAFKNSSIIGPVDLNSILLEYAEKIKISDKLAVNIIITSIDIPEIDQI